MAAQLEGLGDGDGDGDGDRDADVPQVAIMAPVVVLGVVIQDSVARQHVKN